MTTSMFGWWRHAADGPRRDALCAAIAVRMSTPDASPQVAPEHDGDEAAGVHEKRQANRKAIR
jgi:hypothetical protein